MKRLSLNSSLKHSAVQEWLEDELENRGIDSVYARSILSLLQQDYVDVEPNEYFQTRNRQSRVLYKYVGPESVCYITKSKHQKGKTWGKHILTSASPYKAAYYDLESILKKAAVDCLKSASDYVNDIEELIDEVWIKLNTSLKGEQEEKALRNCTTLGRSFFTPPSPTDETEKYFAAFPPLNSKTEHTLETGQHKILKNAWCKKCILKRSSKVRKEEAFNVEDQNFHSNKVMQPIIPYKSLKPIKNIFKNSRFKTPWKATSAQRGSVSKRSGSCKIRDLKELVYVKHLFWSFNNLFCVDKSLFLKHLKAGCARNDLFYKDFSSVILENVTVRSSDVRKLNDLPSNLVEEESTDLIPVIKSESPEGLSNRHAQDSANVFESFLQENPQNDTKEFPEYYGLDIHFRMSPLADLLDYKSPHIELSDMSILCYDNSSELYTKTDAITKPKTLIIQKDNAFTDPKLNSNFVNENETQSLNSIKALSNKKKLYNQTESFSISQSFNPLDALETSHIETFFSDSEASKHVECIESSNFESVSSDDEIYYSDEDSNAILLSECNDKFDFLDNSLQQIDQNSLVKKSSQDSLIRSTVNEASISNNNQHNFTLNDSCEEKSILDRNEFNYEEEAGKILKVNLTNNVNLKNVKSPYEKLSFKLHGQAEYTDKNCDSEMEENYVFFGKNADERKSSVLIEPYSLTEPNNSKVNASNVENFGEEGRMKKKELNDKKWLFYWGDNDNFIARTWQEDFVPVEEKMCNENLIYNEKISTALSQEIKDEEDELLNGLCSVPNIGNTILGNKVCKAVQNDSHSSYLTSHVEILNCHNEKTFIHVPDQKIAVNEVENYNPVFNSNFTFANIENKKPIQNTDNYSLAFESNPFKAANFHDLSAFSNATEDKGSFEDYYMEGGGWSLASDSFADYYCDNSYEISNSLCTLDLEDSNDKFLQSFNRKRQHCSTEPNDIENKSYEETPNLYKRTKPKFVLKKRPCVYFLQGICTRIDCRYSHDLSTTTCRFWKEGSCFKGITCPFLHGYLEDFKIEEDDFKDSDVPDLSYSLESEADFPSLLSSKTKELKVQSGAVDMNMKGSKKKRKEK